MEQESKNNNNYWDTSLAEKCDSINKINFTEREIDIIACLFANKPPKWIASNLAISYRTVEAHIRNISLKISCSSQKEIVDFVNNSDQVELIKKHYSYILIKLKFEESLKKIAKSNHHLTCTLIYNKNLRIKETILSNLKKNLALAGVNVVDKIWLPEKPSISLQDSQSKNKNLIYYLSDKFLEYIQNNYHDLNIEIIKLSKDTPNIVFIIPNNKYNILKEQFSKFTCIANSNEYTLCFEILNILEPTVANNHFNAFKKEHDIMLEQQVQTDPINNTKKRLTHSLSKYWITKVIYNKTWKIVALLMLSTLIVYAMLNSYLNIQSTNQPTENTNPNPVLPKRDVDQKQNIINLPPRNIYFTGRTPQLEQIKHQLNNHNVGVITQAIAGLGGVGKTQLAIEYAYLALENKNYAIIFWIPAETTNTINSAYQELANFLHLNVAGLNIENMQTLVHKKLSTEYKNNKVLFVLDNVPDYESINDYLAKIHKELSPTLSPSVLITSRSQYWPKPPLILDIFTPKEALTFVQKHLSDEKEIHILDLTTNLQRFPLALSQAASYIKKHTNIKDYLALYSTKKTAYLEIFPENKNEYNSTLWKTWNIAFNNLSTSAREILFMSAYLDPDNIPLDLFGELPIEQRINSIRELRKYSFITMINNNQSFKIHRLLQDVIRMSIDHNTVNVNKTVKTNGYWLMKCMDSLNTKFQFDYLRTTKWRNWEKYLAHVLAVSKNTISLQGIVAKKGLCLFIKYAMFLTYINNDGNNAAIAWEHILNATIKHKLSSSFIEATIKIHLSNALSWSGNFHKAKEILNKTIPMYKNPIGNVSQEEIELLDLLRIIPLKTKQFNKGENNCDLSFALSSLGNILYRTGSTKEALESLHNGHDILNADKSLGNRNNYYIIEILHKIGGIYIHLGKFLDADKTLKKAHHIGEEIYANHPKLAVIYANEAILYYHLGNFKKVTNLLNNCSLIRSKLFTSQHQEIASTLLKWGFTNYMLHNSSIAIKNFADAERIYNLYYKEDDSIYIFSKLGLWKTHEQIEQYSHAQKNMDIAVEIAKSTLKNNMQSAFLFQLSQAEFWPTLSSSDSLPYWRNALKANEILFGNNHYQYARYCYLLSQSLANSK